MRGRLTGVSSEGGEVRNPAVFESMNEELWEAVDQYIVDSLVRQDSALGAALHASVNAGLPEIAVAPNQGKLLMLLARLQRARTILEIGTLGGYSTIWLARGLVPDGRLISLEVSAEYAAVARENIARAELTDRVEIRVAPAAQSLEELLAEPDRRPFDFIFIDADKAGYPLYIEAAIKLSRPGTLIVADNVVRKGAIIEPNNQDPNIRGIRRFYELLASDRRVDSTAIQTVGSKGHDGFAFAVVR